MRSAVLVFLFAFGSGAAGVVQTPVDLSGKWIFAGERTAKPDVGPRANFGTEFEVRQDAKALTIERGSGAQKVVAVYAFDGSETTVDVSTSLTKTRARWDAGKFVMEVRSTSRLSSTAGIITVSTRRFWREGDELVSEWVITSPMPLTSVCVYRQAPAASAPKPPARATLADIAWLTGTWEGRMGATSLEERWTPAAGGAMLAVSRTVSDHRMVAFEFLRIIERDGTLVYLAQPNGRAPATEFTLTAFGNDHAVFENPTHDFPKLIRYSLAADGTLTAIISDTAGLKPQHFIFKKG
jgi:uncharacterized protein DUF6265